MESELLASLEAAFGDLGYCVIEILRRDAAQAPHQPAILQPQRESLTYEGLLDLATRAVKALNSLGLTRHSRIALALPTTVDASAVYLCVMAGMTIIPTGPSLPADEYERYLRHSRADAVLVQRDAPSSAREAAARLGIPVIEVEYIANGPAGTFKVVGADDAPDVEPRFAEPGDTAVVLPTSGTTSLPKLVPWRQRELAIVGHFARDVFYVPDAPAYPIVAILPLHLVAGVLSIMRSVCWRVGYTCVYAADVPEVYRYLALYRPASVLAVPAVLQALINESPSHEEELGQFQLKKITVISAALSEPLMRDIQRVFRTAVQVHYGLTEIQTIARSTLGVEDRSYKVGFVGRVHHFCEVRIADEAGAELPAGESGEILVRSPRAFKGYENDPDANSEAFRDGWFRTGDSGYLDANGYLYLTGRVKEVINRGGSKVSPTYVDAVLLQHPSVVEAATFGFPHSALGEDVATAIVLKEPGVTERELRSFAAKRLAMYKVPSRFVFVSEIPKTSLGKVVRRVLAEQFRGELQR